MDFFKRNHTKKQSQIPPYTKPVQPASQQQQKMTASVIEKGMPQVKIVRPELESGATKLQQLGQNAMVKIFDRYFQDQFDLSMNRFEGTRKNTALTLALLEDFAKEGATEHKN